MFQQPIPAPFKNRMSMSLTGGGGIRPAFYFPLTQGMNVSAGDMEEGSMTRDSDFTYIDANGVLQYGYGSRTNLWVDSDPAPTLGSELITNGTFDTDSDWTNLGTWAISDGVLVGTNESTIIYQDAGITGGTTYLVSYDITEYTAGDFKVFFNGTTNTSGQTRAASGSYTEIITAHASANGNISLAKDTSNFTGKVDNISVKEYTEPSGFAMTETYAIPYDWGVEGLDSAVVFGDDSVQREFHFDIAGLTDTTTLLSFYFKADDGSAPDFTTSTSAYNGVALVGTSWGSYLGAEPLGNGIYRCKAISVSTPSGVYGIKKYTGNSSTGFKVSGFQVEELPSDNTLGDEQSSGTLTIGSAYKITATQTDHFYTGCAIGDIFVADAETTLDANNKVQEVPAWVVEHSKLGPELVTNDWSIDTDIAEEISTGVYRIIDGGSGAIIQDIGISPGTAYLLGFEIISIDSGNIKYDFQPSSPISDSITAAGIYEFVVLAEGSANGELHFQANSDGVNAVISNISAKEILDPAIQPARYTETTDSVAAIPIVVPIGTDGLSFQGSAAVNLIPYSEDFSEWNEGADTVVSVSDVVGPDGVSLAYNVSGLLENAGTRLNYVVLSGESTDGRTFSASAFVRGTGTDIGKTIVFAVKRSSGGDANQADTGLVTLTSNWQRINVSQTFGTDNTGVVIYISNEQSATAESVEIFGAQLTEGPMLYNYIPTRGTETAVMPTENVRWTMTDALKGILGDTTAATAAGVDAGEGTVIVEWAPGYDYDASGFGTGGIISVEDSPNYRLLYHASGNGTIVSYDGTIPTAVNVDWAANDTDIVAIRFTKSGTAYQLGVQENAGAWSWDTERAFGGAYIMDTYLSVGIANPGNFHIKKIRFYDRALTTTEIERIA